MPSDLFYVHSVAMSLIGFCMAYSWHIYHMFLLICDVSQGFMVHDSM